MENEVLRNHFRAQCEPHFFNSHGQANGQTLKIILNAPLKPLFWFTFWLTRTLDKFVGTTSHSRCETSLLFLTPCFALLHPHLTEFHSSSCPALLRGGIIPGRTPPSQAGSASTMAQRAPAFLQPRSAPEAPCWVPVTPLGLWEDGAAGEGATEPLLLLCSSQQSNLHKLIVSILSVNEIKLGSPSTQCQL